jgi:hypothetical protein
MLAAVVVRAWQSGGAAPQGQVEARLAPSPNPVVVLTSTLWLTLRTKN